MWVKAAAAALTNTAVTRDHASALDHVRRLCTVILDKPSFGQNSAIERGRFPSRQREGQGQRVRRHNVKSIRQIVENQQPFYRNWGFYPSMRRATMKSKTIQG